MQIKRDFFMFTTFLFSCILLCSTSFPPFLKDLHCIQYVVHCAVPLLYLLIASHLHSRDLHLPHLSRSPIRLLMKTFELQFYHFREVIPMVLPNIILDEINIATIIKTLKG